MHVAMKRGFTLLELLVVVLIIGVLAAITILKFANSKDKAYVATMTSDLHNMVTMEESYNAEFKTYTTSLSAMTFVPSPAVSATVTDATMGGWTATVSHSASAVTCRVGIGSDSIAGVGDGVIQCK